LNQRLQTRVPILLYHRVVPDLFAPALECYRLLQIATSQAAFERQMRYLQANYTVIGLHALAVALQTHQPLPDNACVITFDDSSSDHYHYAYPILKRLGLTATFFVEGAHTASAGSLAVLDRFYYLLDHSPCQSFSLNVSDTIQVQAQRLDLFSKLSMLQHAGLKGWLKQSVPDEQERILSALAEALQVRIDPPALSRDLYLSVAQMQELVQGGMELGAHTMRHPSLLQVDYETARAEICQSGDFVKRVAETDNVAFAYPFGEGSNAPSVRRLVRDYGYYAACTTFSGLNGYATNPLELHRVQLTSDSL